MYTWINKEETEGWEANYCGCCKYKWTIEKFKKVDGSWERTGVYKRFNTLEEARQYALKNLTMVA